MSEKRAPSHSITGLFVFMLLGIFAIFSTVMVLLGARAYRSAVERTGMHNAARISTAYVRSMVRSSDEEGAVMTASAVGLVTDERDDSETEVTVDTVTLATTWENEVYLTRIYIYDGKLREWFGGADSPFYVDNGEPVCDADEMRATVTDGLLHVDIRVGEDWSGLDVALRASVR